MKVIVCGGRDFTDTQHVHNWLDKFHGSKPISLIIEGGARGADRIARNWAQLREIPFQTFLADWESYGRRAGILRNQTMLNQHPDAVIAFPGGRGTANMVFIAKKAGIKVYDGASQL